MNIYLFTKVLLVLERTITEHAEPLEFVVNKAVGHHHTSKNILYYVKWYSYMQDGITSESSKHIPRHCYNRYWNHEYKKCNTHRVQFLSTDKEI